MSSDLGSFSSFLRLRRMRQPVPRTQTLRRRIPDCIGPGGFGQPGKTGEL